ncbi:hypothetical protein L218DRAFT_1006766 [Marasmius fiardii PR-910]|nr:hypothetical protein L218DRAFT_1006766 [Marasmius fiardii PR-910]
MASSQRREETTTAGSNSPSHEDFQSLSPIGEESPGDFSNSELNTGTTNIVLSERAQGKLSQTNLSSPRETPKTPPGMRPTQIDAPAIPSAVTQARAPHGARVSRMDAIGTVPSSSGSHLGTLRNNVDWHCNHMAKTKISFRMICE